MKVEKVSPWALSPLRRAPSFKFGVYDVETYGIKDDELSHIGFYDGSHYRTYRHLSQFLNDVLTPPFSDWHIFAHAGGRFDVHYLFDYIRAFRPDLSFSFYCAGSCVIAFTVTQGKCRWRFTDSYRLMESSLDRLTHEFEAAYLKQRFAPLSARYNEYDCLGLYEVLSSLFKQFDATADTRAALSLKVFRMHYLSRSLPVLTASQEAFVRRAYVGGRCEVYRYDSAVINHYDVNSLYPAAMLAPVPVEFAGSSVRLPQSERKIGFYRASVDYPEAYLPILPVTFDGRLFFPTGHFEGIFCSLELQRAVDEGARIRIHEGLLFHAESVLAPFVQALYAQKAAAEAAGDTAKRAIAKYVMNSLYGKFGQARKQATYIREEAAGNRVIYPLPEGMAYYYRHSSARHILPHIAATVTARARLTLWDHLQTAGQIYYTDTDSIWTVRDLGVSLDIGGLKLEGRGDFHAYGLKEYRFRRDYHLKGVPLGITDPETGERRQNRELARRYLRGDQIKISRRAGILESLRRGLPAVRRVETVRQRRVKIEKRARAGVDTRPWDASEIEEKSG